MTSKQSQSSLSNGFVPPVTTTWFRTYRLRSAQSLPFQKFFVFKFYTSRQKSCKLYNLCCCESDKTDILVGLKQLLHTTPIYLIGMMGSGKSTVGRHLATKLCYSFLDTDQMIESVERKKITEIFQEQGEDKFRVIESNILNQIQPCRGHVVATGGGIVLRSSNWAILRVSVFSISLPFLFPL